jgi:hypothetical protein
VVCLGEVFSNRAGEPAIPGRAVGLKCREAICGELDEGPSAVVRIGTAGHKAVGLKVGDRLRHGLRSHPLREGKVAHAPRSAAIEATEDRSVRQRDAILRA